MQLNYNVDYKLDGKKRTDTKVYCGSPGTAMARVLKSHPGATIIKAWKEGRYGNGYGYQEWLPPKVQREPTKEPRPARALKHHERGCEFPFYDKVARQ